MMNDDFQSNKDTLINLLEAAITKQSILYKKLDCSVSLHPELTRSDVEEIIREDILNFHLISQQIKTASNVLNIQNPLLTHGVFSGSPMARKQEELHEVYSFELRSEQGKGRRLLMTLMAAPVEPLYDVPLNGDSTELSALIVDEGRRDQQDDDSPCCCLFL